MTVRRGSMRAVGVIAGLAALAGFALAALPRPSVTAISSAKGSRTLTISGTDFNRLRAVHVGSRRVHFTLVSTSEVTITVPLRSQTVGTSVSLTFQKITIAWVKKCTQCKDQWGPSG